MVETKETSFDENTHENVSEKSALIVKIWSKPIQEIANKPIIRKENNLLKEKVANCFLYYFYYCTDQFYKIIAKYSKDFSKPTVKRMVRHFQKQFVQVFQDNPNMATAIVTSWAVRLGRDRLGEQKPPQEAASIGQTLLVKAWDEVLKRKNVWQFLLDKNLEKSYEDFKDKNIKRRILRSYSKTVESNLQDDVIPVFNWNDTLDTEELDKVDKDIISEENNEQSNKEDDTTLKLEDNDQVAYFVTEILKNLSTLSYEQLESYNNIRVIFFTTPFTKEKPNGEREIEPYLSYNDIQKKIEEECWEKSEDGTWGMKGKLETIQDMLNQKSDTDIRVVLADIRTSLTEALEMAENKQWNKYATVITK